MMGHRDKMIDGDEVDALTRWKRFLKWRGGERKKMKRKFNKRIRHKARQKIKRMPT